MQASPHAGECLTAEDKTETCQNVYWQEEQHHQLQCQHCQGFGDQMFRQGMVCMMIFFAQFGGGNG
jgi:hypothetical protein